MRLNKEPSKRFGNTYRNLLCSILPLTRVSAKIQNEMNFGSKLSRLSYFINRIMEGLSKDVISMAYDVYHCLENLEMKQ